LNQPLFPLEKFSLIDPLPSGDPICPPFPHRPDRANSACVKNFDHRYVIGVHKATKSVVQKFASAPENYRMVIAPILII
jgi:hypothetical protein